MTAIAARPPALVTRPAPLRLAHAAAAAGPVALRAVTPSPWLPLPRAAELLGVTEASLRLRCQREWTASLKARKDTDAADGRTKWHIHVSVDERLMRSHVVRDDGRGPIAEGRGPLSPVAALSELTAAHRERAMLRARALVRFRAWRSADTTHTLDGFPAFAAQLKAELGIDAGRRTLYAWHEQAPLTDDLPAIAWALADRRGLRGRSGDRDEPSGAITDAAWAMFAELYLTPNQWSARKCWRTVEALAPARGWSWPSYRHVVRQMAQRIEPGVAAFHREGQRSWSKKFSAPFEQDPEAFAPNECWEADHSRCDFFVQVRRGAEVVGVRPWLTLWMDRRTRRIMGWWMDFTPCADTIRWALLSGLRTAPMGPPRLAWLDNGKDFKSASNVGLTRREIARVTSRGGYWLDEAMGMGVLGMLGIECHFARAYNHNGKARIERLFGVIHTDFDRELESWCGSKPGDRDKDTLDAVTAEAGTLPTLEMVRERFGEWVSWYNDARDDHAIDDLRDPDTGDKLTPTAYMQRHTPERRVMPDPRALDLLTPRWSRAMTVSKHGISLKLPGGVARYGDLEPALEPLKNTDRKVIVSYDPADITAVRVYDEQLRFVCVAALNRQYGGARRDPISVAAWKAARKARQAQQRRAQQRPDVAALVLPSAELAAREQRRLDLESRPALPDGPLPTPAVLRLAPTALDGQADRVERAETSRAAKRIAKPIVSDDDEPSIDLSRRIDVTTRDDDADDERLDLSLMGGDDDGHDELTSLLEVIAP
jgi:putative transposase